MGWWGANQSIWSPTLLLYITELLIGYRSDHLHSMISLNYWSVINLITYTPPLYHWTIDQLSIWSPTLLLYITELLISYRSDHLHSSSISLSYWSVMDLITFTPSLCHWAIDRLSIWSNTLLYITELLIGYQSDHLHSSSISLSYWSVIDPISYTPPLYCWTIDRLLIRSPTLLLRLITNQ